MSRGLRMIAQILFLLVSFSVSLSLFAQTHEHYANQHCKYSDMRPAKK